MNKLNIVAKPIITILLYFAVQVAVSFLQLYVPEVTLSSALLLSNVLVILVFWLYRFYSTQRAFSVKDIKTIPSLLALLGGFCGMAGLNLASELLDLPDFMADQFLDIASNYQGIIAIAIIGPICEELTFREIIVRHLLSKGINPWAAIIGSALAFGIVHMNPAQIPFAAAMGVIFAFIYWKTNSVLLPVIIHIVNNSVAVFQMNYYGEKILDFHFYDILGKGVEIVLIIVLMVACIALLRLFGKAYKTERK